MRNILQVFGTVIIFLWGYIYLTSFHVIFPRPSNEIKDIQIQQHEDQTNFEPILLGPDEKNPELQTTVPELAERPTYDLESRIEEKLHDFLENKLVQILLKVDASACLKCTEDDKKIILQIQLIKSLYDSNHKLVDLYLQQIEKLEKRIETDYGRRIRKFEE